MAPFKELKLEVTSIGIFANIGNRINVRGHADLVITTDGSGASKWALSLGRVAAVTNELRCTSYGRQLPIYGLVDNRFSRFYEQTLKSFRSMLTHWADVMVHPHSGDV